VLALRARGFFSLLESASFAAFVLSRGFLCLEFTRANPENRQNLLRPQNRTPGTSGTLGTR